MKENTLQATVFVVIGTILLACIVMGWQHCEAQYDRREACVKSGIDPLQCKTLYPAIGDSQ